MLFIISVLIAAALSYLLRGPLKKHPAPFYIAAAVITALVSVMDFSWTSPFVRNYVIGLFSRGALAAGFWVVIMWLGALPNGSKPVKALMPVRGELSIFTAILTLGHNIGFGRTYFVRMFTSPSSMKPAQFAAGTISIIMLLIMIPLTVMSFKSVRKKMKAKTWKRVQRLAYAFYGLMYVHVMILLSSQARAGRMPARISVAAYSVVFLGYAGMRIAKALSKKKPDKRRGYSVTGCAAALAAVIVVFIVVSPAKSAAKEPEDIGAPESTGDVIPEETEDTVPETDYDTTESDLPDTTTDEPRTDDTTTGEPETTPTETTDAETTKSPETKKHGETTKAPETTASSVTTKAPETSDTTAPETEKTPETTAGTTDAPDTTNAPETTKEPETKKVPETTKAPETTASSTGYKDGSYTGTAYGYDGDITVTVKIEGGKIVSIDAKSEEEDPWYFEQAEKKVTDSIIDKQSDSVDVVSGATYSSKGIMNAVKDALSK